jgi:hypothetical protein
MHKHWNLLADFISVSFETKHWTKIYGGRPRARFYSSLLWTFSFTRCAGTMLMPLHVLEKGIDFKLSLWLTVDVNSLLSV